MKSFRITCAEINYFEIEVDANSIKEAKAKAKKIAEDNNLHPDYYEPFIEFYIEECRESDRGYFFDDQKYMIDLWWDHNKDLYETKTPYIEIKK